MDNFDNATKNSLSGRMHAHDIAKNLFQVQPDKHIQEPPKDSLDLINAPNLNKMLCQKINSFHSSSKLPLSYFKSKMSCIWTKHLKTNLRNMNSLSPAHKV